MIECQERLYIGYLDLFLPRDIGPAAGFSNSSFFLTLADFWQLLCFLCGLLTIYLHAEVSGEHVNWPYLPANLSFAKTSPAVYPPAKHSNYSRFLKPTMFLCAPSFGLYSALSLEHPSLPLCFVPYSFHRSKFRCPTPGSLPWLLPFRLVAPHK